MSENTAKEEIQGKIKGDDSDPLGYLIIPVFGVLLVAVILLWMNQKKEKTDEKFFAVTGKVTVNGVPVTEFGKDVVYQINFYPEDSTNPIASSWIDEDGFYDLRSGQQGIEGALPGTYKVVVIMEGTPDNPFRVSQPYDQIKIDPKDGGTMTPENPDPPFDIDFLEAKTTPQRAIISEEAIEIDFDLPKFDSAKKKKRRKAKEQASKEKSKTKPDGKGNQKEDSDPKSETPKGEQKSAVENKGEPNNQLEPEN